MLGPRVQSEVFLREDVAAILAALERTIRPLAEAAPEYVAGYLAALAAVRVALHSDDDRQSVAERALNLGPAPVRALPARRER